MNRISFLRSLACSLLLSPSLPAAPGRFAKCLNLDEAPDLAYDPSQTVLTAEQRRHAQWALYRALVEQAGEPAAEVNLAVSPASLVETLQALWWGTRGDTALEMAQFFNAAPGVPAADDFPAAPAVVNELVRLRMSSSLWIDREFPLRASYRNLLEERGLGLAETVDWSQPSGALARLNQWGQGASGGKIPALLESRDLNPPVAFVLASVIHFQGAWASGFDPGATREGEFLRLDGSPQNAAYLTGVQPARHAVLENGDAILELPFADHGTRFIAVLPAETGPAALLHLEREAAQHLPAWRQQLADARVRVSLPKFNVRAAQDPKPALNALGIHRVFSAEEADFTGATDRAHLKLDVIRHQAVVSIDERGVEAVGATAAVVTAKGIESGLPQFVADRPFLFYILSSDREPLFAGRVTGLP